MTAAIQGNYGSIHVDSLPPAQVHHHEAPPPRRPLSLMLAAAACVLGLVLLLVTLGGGNNTTSIAPVADLLLTVTDDNDDDRLKENIPHFFRSQVDHFDDTNNDTWNHRYYKQTKYFKGPGHPVILLVGGEEVNNDGFIYLFIEQGLASTFGAYVILPEHRFYGPYRPTNDTSPLVLEKLLTPQQAMQDHLVIAQYYQRKLGCSQDRASKHYCPLITVGGSYPAFLASMMRLLYPDIVDMAYASSAPLLLYAQQADQFGYYDVVTTSAEKASTGCAAAVQETLQEIDDAIHSTNDYTEVADRLNICPGSIPNYIDSNDLFSKEINMIAGYTFADLNMFNYDKNASDTELASMCRLFQDESLDSYGKLETMWTRLQYGWDPSLPCFNMSSQLPTGPNSTISGGDWSGVGPYDDGLMFDFQCCTTLTPAIGFSEASMFPYRKWTLEWLTEHCLSRFNIVPRPTEMVDEWKFDDLVGQGATRILFTNGLNDMWSAGSYLEDLSDSILVINMPNGAHHSEVKHLNVDQEDTPDVMEAHIEITDILAGWLEEIRSEQQ